MQIRSLMDLPFVFRAALTMIGVVGLMLGAAQPGRADDSLAKWTAALDSNDEKTRLAAIDALGQMGPAAKAATAALADQLTAKSPTLRAHAAYALMNIGPGAKAAAPALAKAVSDPDFHVRRMSIAALERIRPEPKIVVAALGKALEDSNPSVRVEALDALTEYGETAVPVLTASLANPDTAYWAALALGELGPRARDAVKGLAGALTDKNPEVRREVLIALARIGPDAAEAVPAIAKQLKDSDGPVRNAAGLALGSIGPAAASAADALHEEMQGEDHLGQCMSCWALARIEPNNKQARQHAITMLLETLKDKNPRVQSAAVRGLMDLGVPPEKLVPALGYVVLNGQEPAVGEAIGALSTMGEAAAEVLDDALTRPAARGRAALLITSLGAKAKATVPALTAALVDKNPDVRREVLFALASIGPAAAPAVGAVQKALSDPEARNRAAAAYALGRIGPKAAPALPKLQEELTSPDALLRVASAYALVKIAPGNKPIVRAALPVLVQGLKNPLPAARRGAAEGLGEVGKPARAAAESALRAAAASDQDASVRKAALEALERMGLVTEKRSSSARR